MFLQDWLTLKVVETPDVIVKGLSSWDKVVYKKDNEKFIGTYIWYRCKPDYSGQFLYKLSDSNLEKFLQLDKKAKEIFDNIKEHLNFIFPNLKFLTAKMDFGADVLYIYFYGETRVDFRPWLKDLRDLIWMNFFLYQVWARDRIRLHPQAKNWIGDCWYSLCCVNNLCKLDSVETSTINLQNLQTQGIEKQKWLCGKLKCCLKYEEKIYEKELEKYPDIGTQLEKDGKKYTVIGINTLSKYIFLKDENWYITRLTYEDYLWSEK